MERGFDVSLGKGKERVVGKGSREKIGGPRLSTNLNRIIQGKGSRFKSVGNFKVLLGESMTNLA